MPGLGFMGVALQALSHLYWVLAICALVFAVYTGKSRRGKAVGAAIVLVIFGFLPGKALLDEYQRDRYGKEAWAYFKKLCDEKSGEKIYKTFAGVKSVVVIKPLPPATDADHFDQYWFGDPYSGPATSGRDEQAATLLTMYSRDGNRRRKGLDFVEMKSVTTGDTYFRITRPASNNEMPRRIVIGEPSSRFGILWEDISTIEDRKYWVAGSRLRIVDLNDNTVIAERIGFFIEAGFGSTEGGRRPWLTSRGPRTTCPPLHGGDYSDNWFVTSVLVQEEEK